MKMQIKWNSGLSHLVMMAFIGILIIPFGCHRNLTPPAPAINSFVLDSVSMTSATFSISASHYTNLSLTVNGVTAGIAGNSATVSGLSANTKYTAHLVATGNGTQSATADLNFTTASSTLKVDSFSVTNSTDNSITFGFASSSDATITSVTLTNFNTGESVNVTGKNIWTLTNLAPATVYMFTLLVDDNAGNEKRDTLHLSTLAKTSTWFDISSVTYGKQFAIEQNAVSSELDIVVNNLSNATKTLKNLTADFGPNGSAIKMLRYRTSDTVSWTVIHQNGFTELMTFNDLTLAPGSTTIQAYFAVKRQAGVADGSVLSFQFVSFEDSDTGSVPHSGAFPGAVSVGTVNATVAPTTIGADGITTLNEIGGEIASNSNPSPFSIINFDFLVTGPAGATLHAITIQNPYAAFVGLVYPDNAWYYPRRKDATYDDQPSSVVWHNGQESATINLPASAGNSQLIMNQDRYNDYTFANVKVTDTTNVEFYSGKYTPNIYSWVLASPFDLVIYNADGQVVDLSDVSLHTR